MDTVAILVDGGFYTRRAKNLWGDRSAKDSAEILHRYCMKHLHHPESGRYVRDRLYRIFYYDCPPTDRNVYHPFLKKDKALKKEPLYAWMTEFQNELRSKRKVALRLGRLSDNDIGYTLSVGTVKKLCNGSVKFEDLSETDFHLNVRQKGVDMRIGIDIASMSYKKQVTKMILIAGDSDFVPAAKLARREGIDFVLDPMGHPINDDLNEHIDGIKSVNTHADLLLSKRERRKSCPSSVRRKPSGSNQKGTGR